MAPVAIPPHPAWDRHRRAGLASSRPGLAALSHGREEQEGGTATNVPPPHEPEQKKGGEGAFDDDDFAAVLAAMDARLERSTRVLAGTVLPHAQDPLALVYDLDWHESARLQAWLRVVEGTRGRPFSRRRSPSTLGKPSSRSNTGHDSGR